MSHKPRIVVVGSANVDLTTFTDRFPRPGETIFAREFHLGFGGKGANQAVAASRCGAEVALVARVGGDLFGPAYIRHLESCGIDVAHVRLTEGVSTGVAPIFVDSDGQNRILVVKGANDRLRPADVDAAGDLLNSAGCVVLQLEIPLETVYHTLRRARDCGIPSILNPAPAHRLDAAEMANADYVIPNETEAELLTGIAVRDVDEARKAAECLLASGVRRVIVTLGANGALLAGPEGAQHVPPFAVQPVDTTGAGDAFIGSFAFSLASGCSEAEAIRRANLYAALSTLSTGTQSSFVTRERLEAEWAERR